MEKRVSKGRKLAIGILVLCVLSAFAEFGNSKDKDNKKEETKTVTVEKINEPKKVSREDEVKNIIKEFISKNPLMFEKDGSINEIEYIQKEKDWAEGERYKIWLKGNKEGNEWVIYLKINEIVGVKYITKTEVQDLYKK